MEKKEDGPVDASVVTSNGSGSATGSLGGNEGAEAVEKLSKKAEKKAEKKALKAQRKAPEGRGTTSDPPSASANSADTSSCSFGFLTGDFFGSSLASGDTSQLRRQNWKRLRELKEDVVHRYQQSRPTSRSLSPSVGTCDASRSEHKRETALAGKEGGAGKEGDSGATEAGGQTNGGPLVWVRGFLQDKRGKGNLCFMVLREELSTVQVVLDGRAFVRSSEKRESSSAADEVERERKADSYDVSAEERKRLLKWSVSLPCESVVDVFGQVRIPEIPITGCTQAVELHAVKVFCVSKALPELPFQLKDASRPEAVQTARRRGSSDDSRLEPSADGQPRYTGAKAAFETEQQQTNDDAAVSEPFPVVRVLQDVRLDNRVLDLRTPAGSAIMKLSSKVCQLFRSFLCERDFTEIHTPKLLGGSTEGGANVFRLKYFGDDAALAQSPQLYKQMAICSGLERVFEIGPVFRAENSNTHRHLCEFTGLDMEMTFRDSFMEVVEFIDELFQHIFQGLMRAEDESSCASGGVFCDSSDGRRLDLLLSTIATQFPNEPFVWLPGKTPYLAFEEAVQLLREDPDRPGESDIPQDISDFDFSTEQEKRLGQLVKRRYDNTDFFVVTHFPLNVRAFYSMPTAPQTASSASTQQPSQQKKDAHHHRMLCNSYDFYMRGEEILSGAQRITDPELLAERAIAKGIPLESLKAYIDGFRLGCPPHGGCGVGLERVVMLFLGLPNIRRVSMFPRDPKRLSP